MKIWIDRDTWGPIYFPIYMDAMGEGEYVVDIPEEKVKEWEELEKKVWEMQDLFEVEYKKAKKKGRDIYK